MGKKYLRKNEFRFDNNPAHFDSNKKPHPAYITARCGHKYKANAITHSQKITNDIDTFDVFENPNKSNKKVSDKRKTRITPPYWQSDKLFSDETIDNFRFSNETRKRIRKYNRKFKQ